MTIYARITISKLFIVLILAGAVVLQASAQSESEPLKAVPRVTNAIQSDPELSYTYKCDDGGGYNDGLNSRRCCQPKEECVVNVSPPFAPPGYISQPNFQTSDPFNGQLNPNQKLKLTLICSSGKKVETVYLEKNKKIKCNSSQKQKGTKILSCKNKSNKSNYSWNLDSYYCKAKMKQ